MVNVPVGVLVAVLSWNVELVVAGLGVKRVVVFAGTPLALRVTEPLKPFDGVIVTV